MDILAVIVAYFAGSISFAVVLCRLLGKPDPRTTGSGNPGATNVLLSGGKMTSLLTLLGDILKSFLPVAIAIHYGVSQTTVAMMCLASLLGHIYPIFHGFKGGKGVASFLGVILATNLTLGWIWIAIWLSVAALSRYSSLAGMSACLATPITISILFGLQESALLLATIVMAIIVVLRHHENIERLIAGKEMKLGKH